MQAIPPKSSSIVKSQDLAITDKNDPLLHFSAKLLKKFEHREDILKAIITDCQTFLWSKFFEDSVDRDIFRSLCYLLVRFSKYPIDPYKLKEFLTSGDDGGNGSGFLNCLKWSLIYAQLSDLNLIFADYFRVMRLMVPMVENKRQTKNIFGVGAGHVYVGRPSEWGNPFDMKRDKLSRRECVIGYAKKQLTVRGFGERALSKLGGKTIFCWCICRELGERILFDSTKVMQCHAEVIGWFCARRILHSREVHNFLSQKHP